MEAILLVGGQGTRLRPLTINTPKPMLPVAGVPLLTHLFTKARDAGVTRLVLATSYKPEVFEEHFGDGSALGIELDYRAETEPLGTGGGIRNVVDALTTDGPYLIFNGDVISGVDLRALVARHTDTGATVTLHLTAVPDPRAFGVVPTAPDGRVLEFLEKVADPPTNLINAGCYVFSKEALTGIPAGEVVSVERQTFPELLAAGALIQSYVDSTYWLDLGTPAAFVRGSADLVMGVAPSPSVPVAGQSLVIDGAEVAADAVLTGGTVIGPGAVVAAGTHLHETVVLAGARIGAGTRITSSIVGAGALIGEDCAVVGAVLGDGVRVGARNELLEGVRVFPGAELAAGAVRFSSDR